MRIIKYQELSQNPLERQWLIISKLNLSFSISETKEREKFAICDFIWTFDRLVGSLIKFKVPGKNSKGVNNETCVEFLETSLLPVKNSSSISTLSTVPTLK